MAYALDRGVVHLGETIDCENGTYHVPGRHPITDTHPMGVVPVREVLVHSSNIGMIKIAQRLVPSDEPKGGTQLPADHRSAARARLRPAHGARHDREPGTITTLANWHRNQTLTSVAFGYEIGVTAVQMATGLQRLLQRRLLKPLRLIKEVRAADGVVNELRARPPRRVISPGTTAAVLDMLRGVVDEGTARRSISRR
jgi:cell division protein FtsI/penicillin-binding protein 2